MLHQKDGSMEFYKIFAIAVALAMDSFAVSIAVGVRLKRVGFRQMFRLSWHFGLFQALMPIAGWIAGLRIRPLVESVDHWVGFGLLALVGLNMIREAFDDDASRAPKTDPTKGLTLVILSIATSIDALAVGFSISIINISIWLPAGVIGMVAGGFTIVGLQLGRRLGSVSKLKHYAEAIGGIILLMIGVKILHEHGVFIF